MVIGFVNIHFPLHMVSAYRMAQQELPNKPKFSKTIFDLIHIFLKFDLNIYIMKTIDSSIPSCIWFLWLFWLLELQEFWSYYIFELDMVLVWVFWPIK